MRTLILSDIHSNLTALQTVLEDAAPFDRVFCLGDVVGYGPDPNECIQTLMALPALTCVKGNHDAAIIGDIDIHVFNTSARLSLEWLSLQLKPENYQWLKALPQRVEKDPFTIVHASPRSPVWEYVMDVEVAWENMAEFETPFCLVGHTHYPCVFSVKEDQADEVQLSVFLPNRPFDLRTKSIVNPGSAGQPRDHNPRASYLIHDDAEVLPWTYHRVAYDVEAVQRRIINAGLPMRHASRLKEGW